MITMKPKGKCVFAAMVVALTAGIWPGALPAQEERQRRNFFGMHTLNSGEPAFKWENFEWTQNLVGRGWVFDYPRDGNYEGLIEKAFQLNLIPCIRVQEGDGGQHPSAGAAQKVAEKILEYKIAHPEYADRLVYLQLWNEPNDPRDFVPADVYADYLVDAFNAIHQAEALAAAAHPTLGLLGTLKVMTPGQNGPSWWDKAFLHNPDAKFAFDVWATHPYPEAAPPHYNHHDSDVYIETTKTVDSYLLDLDMVAQPHGSPARSRRGFPVMITETAYGDKLGISYEGWPKTNRALAAAYNVDGFGQRWYRWPEVLAVHPFLLHHPAWERFAWVPGSSCGSPANPACTSQLRCSEECNGDGVREPKGPHSQYTAVRQLRLSLEGQGMAPARLSPYRGQTGSIRGRVTRADTGAVVPYATVRTDGYAFGHVSLYDGVYEIHGVQTGSYTLTVEKNGYRASSRPITVAAGQTATADFSLTYTGKVSKGIYFIDSTPHGVCPGCNLFSQVLGQTFTVPADVGFVKYAAAKPNIDDITLKFSILDGGPGGPQIGSSITAKLEKGDGANMIGGDWADGQEPPVQPGRTYFLKIERADGQGLYCFASNSNPYGSGGAYVGGQPLSGVDFLGVIRGLTSAVNTATGVLAGTVRDAAGAAIAGASVSTDPGGRSATTDGAGRYTIGAVAVGVYQVTAARSGFVSTTASGVEVRENATTTHDFTLQPGASTGTLRGRVTNASSQSLPATQVTVTPGGRTTTTDSGGLYLLDGIAAGSYSVAASKAGYTSQTKAGVSVVGNQTTTVDFQLAAVVVSPTIVNPHFEDDRGAFQVARGWTRFGGNKWESIWDAARVFTQGIADVPPSGMGGVYQTVGVIKDTRYRVTVHTRVTNTAYQAAVGVDHAGGTNTPAAVFGEPSSSASWTAVTADFLAAGDTATIFLRGRNTQGAYIGGWVQFDGVTIAAVGSSGNNPPNAAVSASPSQGPAPLVVQLDGSASSDPDGDALTYDWDFGDGSAHGTTAKATRTYAAVGTYVAKLTVRDSKGAVGQTSVSLTALGAAPPGSVVWDSRLTTLGVRLVQASVPSGTAYWKLVRAAFESDGEILPQPGGGSESRGTRNIYYKALGANGAPLENRKAAAAWPTGSPTNSVPVFTKGPLDNYWADFPLSGGNWCPYYPEGPRGPYGAYMADAPSDKVWGFGLPCNRHVSFRLTWQWTVKP